MSERLLRCACVCAAITLAVPFAASGESPFRVDTLDEGVWLLRPESDALRYVNSLVFELDAGLLVVEAQPSPAAARALLERITTLSDRPLRYLVISHPHLESAGGVSAFPSSTLVLTSTGAQRVLSDESRDLLAEMRMLDPDAASQAPARRRADVVISSTIRLEDAETPVEIVVTRGGHYSEQVVVYWNDRSSIYAGPLVFPDGKPYADPESSMLGAWIATLNQLATQQVERIVPLRGAPIGQAELRKQRDAVAWVFNEVQFLLVEQMGVDEIADAVLGSEKLGRYFDKGDEPFLARTLIERAIVEASERNKKKN